jgi:hypothetical protein
VIYEKKPGTEGWSERRNRNSKLNLRRLNSYRKMFHNRAGRFRNLRSEALARSPYCCAAAPCFGLFLAGVFFAGTMGATGCNST